MNIRSMIVAAVFGVAIIGQDSRPTKPVEPAELVGALEHESYDVRMKAMEELRALGESARTSLEAHRDDKRLETRTRVRELLSELDERKAGVPPDSVERRLQPEEGSASGRRGRARPPTPIGPDIFPDIHKQLEEMRRMQEEMEKALREDAGRLRLEPFPGGGPGEVFRFDLGAGGTRSTRTVVRDGEVVTLTQDGAGVTFEARAAGGSTTTSVKAGSLEELREAHPELVERYGDTGLFSGGSVVLRGGLPDSRGRNAVPAPGATSRPSGARRLEPLAPGPHEPDRTPPPRPDRPAARLGAWLATVPPLLDKHLKLGGSGVVVEIVEPESAASAAEMKVDDILTHVGETAVRNPEGVRRAIEAAEGDVVLRVVREGVPLELKIPARKLR